MKLRQIATAAILCLFSIMALAQREMGTISGTVTDSTGAIIANGKITVKSSTNGAVRSVSTNQAGAYSVPDLQPGPYEVTVEHLGFSTIKAKVEVTVGTITRLDASMKVGSKMETIEVTAEPETTKVNVENQTLSTVISAREVTELPSLTRNIYDFVKTSGNVSEGGYGGSAMGGLGLTARGAGVSINGQRAAGTDLLLDGTENVDIFGAGVGQSVPLDSVQEFSVLTNNFTAEYGRASGGVVNVATKAGGNNYHGSLYEFNRVSALASNTPENGDTIDPATGQPVKKSVFTRNQFGYSVGGPIKKDKMFFFSSTEWTRIRSNAQTIRLLPDAAFIAASNANTQNFFNSLGARRSNLKSLGVITAGQVKADIAATPGAFFSLPDATPVFDRVSYAVPSDAGAGTPQNTYSMVNRFDYNFNTNTTMYARYAYSSENDMTGSNNNSPYAGYDTGASQQNHNALISVTHVFTPAIVSQSKVTYNRFFNFQPLGTAAVGPTMYFTGTTPLKVLGTTVDLPGYSAESPGNAIPFGGPQNLYQVSQDLSWTKGNHQFRFGGAYVHMRDNRTFGAYEEAVEDLSTGSKVAGFNNFVTGNLKDFQAAINPQGKYPCPRDPVTGAITTDPTLLAGCTVNLPVSAPSFNRNNRFNDASLYAQDSWKIIPRLTINAGMRWEYFGVQHNANPMLDSNFYFGSGATMFDRIRNGSMQLAPNSPNGELWKPSYGNFAPRLGFAWDPFGNHKTSVRGGYGISYERNFGNVTFNVIQNPPNYFVLGITAGDPGFPTLNITPNNAGPLSGTGSKQLPRSTGRIVDPNIPTAYAEFWSLTVEHEVAKNTLVGVDYTGSNGIHLYDIANINQNGSGTVYLGDPGINRLDPQYGNLNYRGANGFSRYNALNARLQSRNLFNTGLQFNMNYTWAHAIDNLSSTFSESTNNANLGYLDPFNPGLDKGNADFDVRHRLTTSAIWDIPWLKNAQKTWVRQAFGGWSVAPIFTARTGTPYTIYDCTNAAFVRCPRMVSSAITSVDGSAGSSTKVAGSPNLYNWYTIPVSTPYADTATGSGEFPNCTGPEGKGCAWPTNMTGRNMFRGPGWWNADLGIYKHLKLTERFGLQLRGEMYNLFNHHNFVLDGSNNDVSGTSTMQVKKYGTRNVQLGAKVTF